jgi:hypothetical protein
MYFVEMRRNVLVLLFCFGAVLGGGCKKREAPPPVPRSSQQSNSAPVDVCDLLTKSEIAAIQGSPIKDAKSSVLPESGFRISQRFYTAGRGPR